MKLARRRNLALVALGSDRFILSRCVCQEVATVKDMQFPIYHVPFKNDFISKRGISFGNIVNLVSCRCKAVVSSNG